MKPEVRFLSDDLIGDIVGEARILINELGAEIQNPQVLDLLGDNGARVDPASSRAFFPASLVDSALESVPSRFPLYDVYGEQTHDIGGGQVYFTPGSSGTRFLDSHTNEIRSVQSEDYVNLAKVVSGLPNIAAQSTSMIPADVPEEVSDSYRLFLSLLLCPKPVVTGAFTATGFELMKNLQLAVRGSEEELRMKPLTIFSCCPTSPLKWCVATSSNLVDCARLGIPVELISMPLAGFMAPVTLVGSLILHTAETLTGLVIHQLANPGAPILYGGSPAPFDIRFETTPMGAPESMMICCAYSEIGKSLGVPTQAYISLSDAKQLDVQAGLESSMGATLAVLSGIDQVSGPGMLDFENCMSLGKLVVDNEICGLSFRLGRGITPREDFPSLPHFQELIQERHLLISDHTRKYLRQEIHFPGPTINRGSLERWRKKGSQTVGQIAAQQVQKLLDRWEPLSLAGEVKKDLMGLMAAAAAKHGMDQLPVDLSDK